MNPGERDSGAFDEVAADYDAVRPGYPVDLIEDIVALSALPPGASILEVGCGTGQATMPFARRGDRVTCLDIGAELLAIARRKFARYPNVTFHQIAFEAFPAAPESFDLVMSATAFHWIAPESGYRKAAAVLKRGGSLAIFANEHRPMASDFAEDLHRIEEAIVPSWPDPRTPPHLETVIAETAASIDATRLFAPVIVRTYAWNQAYPTATYLRLLNTYSNYRSLDATTRARLFEAIGDLIERKHGGAITKSYLAVLYLARR